MDDLFKGETGVPYGLLSELQQEYFKNQIVSKLNES
jgi:multidrug resistance efflux pump